MSNNEMVESRGRKEILATISVAGIVTDESPYMNYLMLARKRATKQWTLPSGGLKEIKVENETRLETPDEALVREIREEIGVNIKDPKALIEEPRIIGTINIPGVDKNRIGIIYLLRLNDLANITSINGSPTDPQEIDSLRYFTPFEIRELIISRDNIFKPAINVGVLAWWLCEGRYKYSEAVRPQTDLVFSSDISLDDMPLNEVVIKLADNALNRNHLILY